MLRPRALAVAEQVACFAREAEAAGRRMRSQIRLSVDEYLISTMIVPALTRFSAEYPDVQVDVDASATWRDLQSGEADIAVRAGRTPEEPSLVRRKLVDDPWAVYCSAAYAGTRGAPLDLADLATHPMVCLDAALEGARALGLDGAVRQVVNSLSAALAVVRAGAHVGALPRVVADRAPDLRLCFPVPGPTAIWLVFPERLRHVREVRALAGLIAETFRRSDADAAEA
jgi:DNA-binding transcriptional LysR family regulator